MPNLHNQYKSAERNISQKNPEYILNYSLPCSCSNGQLKKYLFLVTAAILNGGRTEQKVTTLDKDLARNISAKYDSNPYSGS
jgi:hypothetical protein